MSFSGDPNESPVKRSCGIHAKTLSGIGLKAGCSQDWLPHGCDWTSEMLYLARHLGSFQFRNKTVRSASITCAALPGTGGYTAS
jgi:hypothetical protein